MELAAQGRSSGGGIFGQLEASLVVNKAIMGANTGKEQSKNSPRVAERAGQKMFISTIGRAELFNR